MDGFVATSSEGEERVVRRDGSELRKLHRKVVIERTVSKEIFEETVVESRTIYKEGLKALAAFHTEKERARTEGATIQGVDSMTEPLLKKKPHQDFLQRKRKMLGGFYKE